jgi:hypothetical protein
MTYVIDEPNVSNPMTLDGIAYTHDIPACPVTCTVKDIDPAVSTLPTWLTITGANGADTATTGGIGSVEFSVDTWDVDLHAELHQFHVDCQANSLSVLPQKLVTITFEDKCTDKDEVSITIVPHAVADISHAIWEDA